MKPLPTAVNRPLYRRTLVCLQPMMPAATFLLFVGFANADPITFTPTETVIFTTPGATVSFSGKITNGSGVSFDTSELGLNISSFNGLVLTPIPVLGTPDVTIPDGTTSAVLDIFDVLVSASALSGSYPLTLVLTNPQNDSTTPARLAVNIVPEPRALILLGIGFAGLLFRMRSRRASGTMLTAAVVLALAGRSANAQSPIITLGPPGTALDNSTFLVAADLTDTGGTATNVQITSARLNPATLTTSLPLGLGTLGPNESATFQLAFQAGSLTPGTRYTLVVAGQYGFGGATQNFLVTRPLTVPPASPGSATVGTTTAGPGFTSGAVFLPEPPVFPNEVNEPGPPVPIGTLVGDMSPHQQSSEPVLPFNTLIGPRPAAANFQFLKNTSFSFLSFGLIPPDSSGAAGGTVAFAANNTFAAYSKDSGATFTSFNPTTVFPNNADGGLCCDQVVLYVPKIDRFIWLMQFWRATRPGDAAGKPSGPNRLRLASASPQDIANCNAGCWTYWDLTSATFGFGNNWMDYPDLTVGDNYLYVSVDEVGTGLFAMRIPLSQIQNSQTINIDYTHPSDGGSAYEGHLMQNTGNELFWAGEKTNSKLQVFSLAEGSNTYFWRDVTVNSWPSSTFTSLAPDGLDWLGFVSGLRVIGATRRNTGGFFGAPVVTELWFAWPAGSGGGFAQSHIQIAQINRADFSVINQFQVWNSTIAFSYPALSTDSDGEIGMSLGYGGGGNYGSHAVGYWGDFVVYATAVSNITASYTVTRSDGTTFTQPRYGDYFAIRPNSPDGSVFAATGYSVNTDTSDTNGCSIVQGCKYDPHFILFSRPPVIIQ